MSEYQYYEFIAIDRPLTKKQMAEVRNVSTRAELTPTSFTNEYHFGDFKGSPESFLTHFYDAMLYYANWGTHRFMLALPANDVNAKEFEQYVGEYGLNITTKSGRLILDFTLDDESDEWDESYDYSMASLVGVREELLRGDLRSLYLGWLAGLHLEMDDADGDEPVVPPGLKRLTPAQRALADFLRVNDELLSVAADSSTDLSADTSGLSEWIQSLPVTEKDAMLFAAAAGESLNVGSLLSRRFALSQKKSSKSDGLRRSVAALLQKARTRRDSREEAERLARQAQRARAEAKRAAERKKYLDELSKRKDTVWSQVDTLIQQRLPATYDQAVTLLCDLKDLAIREETLDNSRRACGSCATHTEASRVF